MPPKGSRKVTSKQSKSAKKKAPRTPLPSVPAPPKITLKLTPRASSTPQLSLPSEPLIIQSPSPPQIEVWVVELEIKCYLDGERITSTLGRVTNDPYGGGSTYSSIKQNAEEVADRLIEIRGISNLRRDHICWYGTYGAVNNPSEVDIANEGDFDHVVARVRNSGTKGKDKLLKLQICFGIVLQPSTMVRPPWKDAPVVKAPIIAIPKRVYNEETSPATTAKKPRTATTRLLEDEEKKREAEKGTLQEVITSIQVHWICRVDSCTSSTKFCWRNDDKHYYLSATDLRRWADDIQAGLATIDEPNQHHRVQLSIEFADRRNDQLKTKGKKKRRKTYHDNSSSPERPPPAQYAFQPPFWLSNAFPFQYQSMQQAPVWSAYAGGPPAYPHPSYRPQLHVPPPSYEYTAPEPQLPPIQRSERVESEFVSMANLRQSSPLRSGGKSTEELLFALKTFLCNTSTSATPSYNYAFRILIEEEYDIDMIKEMTIAEAKELNIKVGVLKTIKRQLSPFKKWYNQQNHMEEEPGEELDEDEEGEDEEK